VRDGVAGAFGRFDRAAVGPGLIAAQPLVAEARGGARPFAGAGAQRLAELGTARDFRRAGVHKPPPMSMALVTLTALMASVALIASIIPVTLIVARLVPARGRRSMDAPRTQRGQGSCSARQRHADAKRDHPPARHEEPQPP